MNRVLTVLVRFAARGEFAERAEDAERRRLLRRLQSLEAHCRVRVGCKTAQQPLIGFSGDVAQSFQNGREVFSRDALTVEEPHCIPVGLKLKAP